MIIELSCHDLDIKEIELKNIITESHKFQMNYISVFGYYIRQLKKLSHNHYKISSPIDYPLGISDLKSRQTEINNAIKNGVNKLDIVIPIPYLINRKYDKFREDIKVNLSLCLEANVEIAYMLEYRVFSHIALAKIADILKECGVNNIYSSTGHMLDDIIDNTVASMYLAKKSNINTIINGNIWKKDQIKNIIAYNPYGIRFKNLYSLKLWHEEIEKK